MTELTPREILDAIRRGLEESSRRFDKDRNDQTLQRQQPDRRASDLVQQDSRSRQ